MRRVLLTDCDRAFLDHLEHKLRGHYDVRICSYGPDVLEEYLTFQPQLLVLDTGLPGCDVAGLLHTAWSRDVETKVLATACGFHAAMTDMLPQAACILVKPYDDTLLMARLEELEQLLDQDDGHRFLDRTNAILQELGLERNQVGFSCLAEASLYLHDHPTCLFSDELYPHTAKICGGTAQSVDKAMHRCVKKAWDRRNPLIWNDYLKTASCPSNACFIKAIANALDR